MARRLIFMAALVAALLPVSGAGGTDAQTPKRGGTVVFGPVREPACLAFFHARCADGGPAYDAVSEKVLAPAFIIGSDFAWRPQLVSSVHFTRQAPFTLTYRIRREARWSDGIPVTARDFIFTLRATRAFGSENERVLYRVVRSARAIDAKTLRVILRPRFAGWRELFQNVLPRHALAGEDLSRVWGAEIDNPKSGRSIGSGPFLLESWDRGRQLTLRRNPRYWGAHDAYLDRIVIRFCRQTCNAPPSAEVLERLRQGEVDFAFTRDTGTVTDLRRIRGIDTLAAYTTGWEHLDIRSGPRSHPALADKRVRRALAYGIDRVAIVRQLLGEVDSTYRPSDSAVFLNTSRYYRPNWSGYRYRPALARSLLEQAGCSLGADGVYVCAGVRLSLRFVTSPGQPLRERILRLVQVQLRLAGVEAVPVFGTTSGEGDLFLFAWFHPPEPGLKYIFGCGGDLNLTGYCQRLVTKDLDQADRILDADQRAHVLNRADKQLAKDVPVIPLFQVPLLFAFKTTIRGVDPAPFDAFWNAEDWWLDD